MISKMLFPSFILTLFLFTSTVWGQSCHDNTVSPQPKSRERQSQTPTPKRQTVCPVMGGTIDPSVFSDWEGNERNTPKRVYFCCSPCIRTFNRRPERHIRRLFRMGQPVENIKLDNSDNNDDSQGIDQDDHSDHH